MKNKIKVESDETAKNFVEGVDYYFENGLMILTALFLRKRGYCCRNGCRNCPYAAEDKAEVYNKNVSNSRI